MTSRVKLAQPNLHRPNMPVFPSINSGQGANFESGEYRSSWTDRSERAKPTPSKPNKPLQSHSQASVRPVTIEAFLHSHRRVEGILLKGQEAPVSRSIDVSDGQIRFTSTWNPPDRPKETSQTPLTSRHERQNYSPLVRAGASIYAPQMTFSSKKLDKKVDSDYTPAVYQIGFESGRAVKKPIVPNRKQVNDQTRQMHSSAHLRKSNPQTDLLRRGNTQNYKP